MAPDDIASEDNDKREPLSPESLRYNILQDLKSIESISIGLEDDHPIAAKAIRRRTSSAMESLKRLILELGYRQQ